MRPNYKALAKKYRDDCVRLIESLREATASRLSDRESIKAKDREIEKWKAKYAEAMDMLIDTQERIWMQGENQK